MPAQAQKHITHNESIELLDTIVNLRVEAINIDVPPTSPAEGQSWIVGSAATGDWSGQESKVATFRNGGWLFLEPSDGWMCWDENAASLRVFVEGNWLAIAPATYEGLSGLGINSNSNASNPLSVAGPASIFTHAGGDHQLKINKNSTGDSASIVLQNADSSRADFGLIGSDDFSIRVSSDGTNWVDGILIASNGERVSTPHILRFEPNSEPATPIEGDVYFDTLSKKLRCFDGLIWQDLF